MKVRKNMVQDESVHPVSVGFVIMEEGQSETFLNYSDGSKGPLPPGKTYFDYLPEENQQGFIKAVADMLVKEILRDLQPDD